MMNLHIATPNKFTIPFFKFIEENNIGNENIILSRGGGDAPDDMNFRYSAHSFLIFTIKLLNLGLRADKIIIHGLFDPRIVLALFFQPWLLKKCYWMVFGADLYAYNTNRLSAKGRFKELFRSRVIKKIGFVVTSIQGDYENAVKWYNAEGKRLPYYAYPASLFSQNKVGANRSDDKIRILLGNSADPTNHHEEILNKLSNFKNDSIIVYCPLSYGEKEYSEKIAKLGCSMLGDKFVPMFDFIEPHDYINFLETIDIAIFNHNRQQAMSTTRVLLGYGKKVYLRADTSSYQALTDLGLKVFDVNNVDLDPRFSEKDTNREIICRVYSEKTLRKNLFIILEDKFLS